MKRSLRHRTERLAVWAMALLALALVACEPSQEVAQARLGESIEVGGLDTGLSDFLRTSYGSSDEGRVWAAAALAEAGEPLRALALLPASASSPDWLAVACTQRMNQIVDQFGAELEPPHFGEAAAWNNCLRRIDMWRNGAPIAAAWARYLLNGEYVYTSLSRFTGYGGDNQQALLARLHTEAAEQISEITQQRVVRYIRAYEAHPTPEAAQDLERRLVEYAAAAMSDSAQLSFSIAEYLYRGTIDGFEPTESGRHEGIRLARRASIQLMADSMQSAFEEQLESGEAERSYWVASEEHFVFPAAEQGERERQLADLFYSLAAVQRPETPLTMAQLFEPCAGADEPCTVTFRDLARARASHILTTTARGDSVEADNE